MCSIQRPRRRPFLLFDLPVGSFIENFLVLPETKEILLGISFCTKNNLVIDFRNRLLKLPDFTLQLNRLKKSDEATDRLNNRKQIDLFLNNCEQLNPFEQKFVCTSTQPPVCLQSTTGIVEPLNSVEQEHEICLTSSLDTFNSDNEVYLGIINASPNPILLQSTLKLLSFPFSPQNKPISFYLLNQQSWLSRNSINTFRSFSKITNIDNIE